MRKLNKKQLINIIGKGTESKSTGPHDMVMTPIRNSKV